MEFNDLLQVSRSLGVKEIFQGKINRFSVDSRTIQQGDLFFAIPGAVVDPHQFLNEVENRGGIGAVVEEGRALPPLKLPLIRVKNVLEALQYLAYQKIILGRAKIIGVTGSVGKTSTKHFIGELLSVLFSVTVSPGNANSQIGLPLTVLNHYTGKEDFLILEMGMTQAGQISRLVNIAPPDIAVVTKVTYCHSESFQNLEEIIEAKSEIMRHPKTRLSVIDHQLKQELQGVGTGLKLTFSVKDAEADIYWKLAGKSTVRANKRIFSLSPSPVIARHFSHNLLAAVTIALELGMSPEKIQEGVNSITLPEARSVERLIDGVFFLDDSYNACADSVNAMLECLPDPKNSGRKIAVIGEMLELGKFSESCHREVGLVALKHVDLMFCLGKESLPVFEVWKEKGKFVQHFLDRKALAKSLIEYLKEGDVVLVKGSRRTGLSRLIDEWKSMKAENA